MSDKTPRNSDYPKEMTPSQRSTEQRNTNTDVYLLKQALRSQLEMIVSSLSRKSPRLPDEKETPDENHPLTHFDRAYRYMIAQDTEGIAMEMTAALELLQLENNWVFIENLCRRGRIDRAMESAQGFLFCALAHMEIPRSNIQRIMEATLYYIENTCIWTN